MPLLRDVPVAEVRLRPLRMGLAWARAGYQGEGGEEGREGTHLEVRGRGSRARRSCSADACFRLRSGHPCAAMSVTPSPDGGGDIPERRVVDLVDTQSGLDGHRALINTQKR